MCVSVCECVLQGKKAFSVYLPHRITCMAPVNIRRARPMGALGVGLSNGEVRIYNEKALVGNSSPLTPLTLPPPLPPAARVVKVG